MKYYTAYIWEQGKRPENEDSLALVSVTIGRTPVIMAVVADGVGSLYKSENASSHVTYSLKASFEESTHTDKCTSLRHLRRLMCRTLSRCHNDLKLRFSDHNTGTTCSLVVLVGRRGFLINIGDSRVYKLPGNGSAHKGSSLQAHARLLTKDDIINRVLVKCIGTGRYHRPQIKRIYMKNNEALLLATDGFYRRLHKELLNSHIPADTESHLNEWLADLYDTRVKNIESDNSTAIVIATTKGGSNE